MTIPNGICEQDDVTVPDHIQIKVCRSHRQRYRILLLGKGDCSILEGHCTIPITSRFKYIAVLTSKEVELLQEGIGH